MPPAKCKARSHAAAPLNLTADVGADDYLMKMAVAIALACLAYASIAEDDVAIDPWRINDKLDPKLYERTLPQVHTSLLTSTIQVSSNSPDIPLLPLTNEPTSLIATNVSGSDDLYVNWAHRIWAIRGTKFADLIYLGIIQKDGKRHVCLAPQGLGMRAIPWDDLSDEDRRAVEAFENMKAAKK